MHERRTSVEKRRAVGLLVGLALAAAATAATPTATSESQLVAGTLSLQGTLRLVSVPVDCPSDQPPDATECRARTGEGRVRGLGSVSETYTWSYRIGAANLFGVRR